MIMQMLTRGVSGSPLVASFEPCRSRTHGSAFRPVAVGQRRRLDTRAAPRVEGWDPNEQGGCVCCPCSSCTTVCCIACCPMLIKQFCPMTITGAGSFTTPATRSRAESTGDRPVAGDVSVRHTSGVGTRHHRDAAIWRRTVQTDRFQPDPGDSPSIGSGSSRSATSSKPVSGTSGALSSPANRLR